MAHLRALVTRIRLFYDPTREPLRRRVYTVLVMLVGYAVTAGIVTASLATSLVGIGALVLVVPAVELARQKVTPSAAPVLDTSTDTVGQHAAPGRA